MAVIAEGHPMSSVAQQWGLSRQTVHAWLGRYEDGGLEGLADRSHRPVSCPHQMPAAVEAAALELRRMHRAWGPRRRMVVLEALTAVGSGDVPVEPRTVDTPEEAEAAASRAPQLCW